MRLLIVLFRCFCDDDGRVDGTGTIGRNLCITYFCFSDYLPIWFAKGLLSTLSTESIAI